MATRRNENSGQADGVPRWVRLVMDAHEARMEAHEARMEAHEARMEEHERSLEEMRREHEDRMDVLERLLRNQRNEQIQMRLQTARLVQLVEDVRRDHNILVRFVKGLHGRVSRLDARRA